MIKIDVNVSANLDSVEIPEQLQRKALANAADQVADTLSENFHSLPGLHFWHKAADSVDVQTESPGKKMSVIVTHRGVRLQWLGLDPNKPKHAKLLALPASKAISEKPRAYSNLVAIFPSPSPGPKLRGWLVEGEKAIAKRRHKDKPAGRQITRAVIRGGRPVIYFSLVTHSTHHPHPQVIPPLSRLNKVTKAAFSETFNQHFRHHNA